MRLTWRFCERKICGRAIHSKIHEDKTHQTDPAEISNKSHFLLKKYIYEKSKNHRENIGNKNIATFNV
jgi:hypothetical protein